MISCMKKLLFVLSLLASIGQFTQIPAQGLPGEFLVNQRWQSLFSSRSAIANPALISEENYLSTKLAYSSILSTFKFFELGVTYPIGLYQTAGITWINNSVSPYAFSDENGPVPGAAPISDNKNYFAFSYANNISNRLIIGANITILNEVLDKTKNTTAGLDVGLTYRIINNPLLGYHVLGSNLQNAFMIPFSKKIGKQEYPRTLRLSLTSNYGERTVETDIEMAIKDIGVSNKEFNDSSSAIPKWDLNTRLGFWVLKVATLNGLLGMDESGIEHLGFSLGFNFPSINNGRDLSFAYQFLNVLNENEKGFSASSHTMYLKTDFGKHREEIYAALMARLVSLKPNDLYLKAVALYNQDNFWDAFFVFSELHVEFPDFVKSDWVSYFLGSCQEKLSMNTTSEDGYKKTKDQYKRSSAVPFADLGLMRIYYRDGNYRNVENQFDKLNKPDVPDSLKFHAIYIMGESAMNQGNAVKAKHFFDLIPGTHPDYVFAQHSSAVSDALNGKVESAVDYLQNCVQAPVVTKAQKEMVNRSYVFLGYLFYENIAKEDSALAKSVAALRRIPKESFYYPDAMLGLGWAALNARQWQDCSNAGAALMSVAPNIVLKAEGALLQAYSNMMQKNYSAAVSLLEGASQDLDNYKGQDANEYAQKVLEYDSTRENYTRVARKAFELGTTRQSSLAIKIIDSLHIHQKDCKNKIDNFKSYSDDYKRSSFFSRNSKTVKDDVNYALAKAQSLLGQKKQTEETEKSTEKQNKIDKELEKLQKQLQETEGAE